MKTKKMTAGSLFAIVSAGSEPIRVSNNVILEEGPNCTVLLKEKNGGIWTTARITMSNDKRLVAIAKKVSF